MLSKQFFFLSSNQLFLPFAFCFCPCLLLLFNSFCFFIGFQFLLPHPLNFPLVLLFFHSPFLLDHLLEAIFFCQPLKHFRSEFSLHSLLFFELLSLLFFGFFFSSLHLILLAESLLLLFLFLFSHFCLVFLLIKISSQTFDFFSLSPLPFLLFLQFFKNFIFCFFFFLLCLLHCFLSSIKFLNIT